MKAAKERLPWWPQYSAAAKLPLYKAGHHQPVKRRSAKHSLAEELMRRIDRRWPPEKQPYKN